MSIDEHLKNLAIAAQQHHPETQERRRALEQLIQAIQGSGKLCHPYPGQFGGLYQDIYEVACQRLFIQICEKIDSYNPQAGEVLQWVNSLLKWRFIDSISDIIQTIPHVRKKDNQAQTSQPIRVSIEHLDQFLPPEESSFLSQEIIRCIEEDSEGIFQSACLEDCPAANFKFLVKKIVAGYKWREIAQELGMENRVASLSSFYQRSVRRFAPQIQRYCQQ